MARSSVEAEYKVIARKDGCLLCDLVTSYLLYSLIPFIILHP